MICFLGEQSAWFFLLSPFSFFLSYVSFQKSGKKGGRRENISKRPASIRKEHTKRPVSGMASKKSSGPTA
jgi:hypothetical protein